MTATENVSCCDPSRGCRRRWWTSMMSPRIAMAGRKYSKKPVPLASSGGPITREGSCFGSIRSKFSQIVSGNGAVHRLCQQGSSGALGRMPMVLTVDLTVRVRHRKNRIKGQTQMPIEAV